MYTNFLVSNIDSAIISNITTISLAFYKIIKHIVFLCKKCINANLHSNLNYRINYNSVFWLSWTFSKMHLLSCCTKVTMCWYEYKQCKTIKNQFSILAKNCEDCNIWNWKYGIFKEHMSESEIELINELLIGLWTYN